MFELQEYLVSEPCTCMPVLPQFVSKADVDRYISRKSVYEYVVPLASLGVWKANEELRNLVAQSCH